MDAVTTAVGAAHRKGLLGHTCRPCVSTKNKVGTCIELRSPSAAPDARAATQLGLQPWARARDLLGTPVLGGTPLCAHRTPEPRGDVGTGGRVLQGPNCGAGSSLGAKTGSVRKTLGKRSHSQGPISFCGTRAQCTTPVISAPIAAPQPCSTASAARSTPRDSPHCKSSHRTAPQIDVTTGYCCEQLIAIGARTTGHLRSGFCVSRPRAKKRIFQPQLPAAPALCVSRRNQDLPVAPKVRSAERRPDPCYRDVLPDSQQH